MRRYPTRPFRRRMITNRTACCRTLAHREALEASRERSAVRGRRRCTTHSLTPSCWAVADRPAAHGTRALTSEPDQAALTARAPAVSTNRRTSSPFAPDRAQCAVCARRRAPCFQGPLAGSTLGCRLSRNSAVTPLLCPIYLVGEWMDGSKEQRGFAFDVGASAGAPPNLSGVGSIETCIPSSFPQAPRAPPCEVRCLRGASHAPSLNLPPRPRALASRSSLTGRST